MKKLWLIIILFVSMLIAQSEFGEGFQLSDSILPPEAETTVSSADTTKIEEYSKTPIFIQNIFDGKNLNIEEIIAGDDPELNGFISNIQAAPYDNNILSFEVTTPGDPSIKLVLYNMESQFLVQVSAIENYNERIKMVPYPVKDQGANWHPFKNYLMFYSNGYENREQLFMVEINDPYLMDESSVVVNRIDFEEPKRTINTSLYADFNSTGDDIYFTVKIQKENKNEKYNKDFNIAYTKDIFKYKDSEYSGVKYDLVFNKKNNQIKPVCSPADPNVFAYVYHKKELKEGYGYADYYINVYDMTTGSNHTVADLTGFTDYPYQWSPSGKKLYFFNALPLSKTPKNFKDDRINKINLQVADIIVTPEKITSKVEKNINSEIIMGDVATREKGIAFVTEDLILMGKYDPYESIFMVDMNKWRENDGFYAKQLAISQDNDFPVLTKDAFLFLKYEYFKTATISSICSILYEPKIDEEALKAKAERRKNKKSKRAKAKQEGSEAPSE